MKKSITPNTNESNLECNKSLFNRVASRYDHFLVQFWMKRFHKPVLKEVDFSKNNKILDLSCGTGELLKELQKRSNDKSIFYGVDISEEMLNISKSKFFNNAVFQKSDVHTLPFLDNQFDYVITTEAFHHYYDQQKVLLEMKRVVKIKGKIIVVDINFFFNFVHKIFERFEPGCVKVNNIKEMKDLFKSVGLNIRSQKRGFIFSVITIA